jgi:hypothetical protein
MQTLRYIVAASVCKSVAPITLLIVRFIPGELNSLLVVALLNCGMSVMIYTCLGSASHST